MALATKTPEAKGRKGAVIITLIIVALLAAGIFWYMQTNNTPPDNGPNTEKLTENLKGIDEQDKQYANIKTIHLQPSNDVEKQYQVLRPLEQVSSAATGSEQSNDGTLTAKEAYAIGKNNGDGKARYNASFFTYQLAGSIAEKSTDQIVKDQLDKAIAGAKQSQQPANGTVTVGEPEKSTEITLKTDSDQTVKLSSSKFEQTITTTNSGSITEKKLVVLVAAAKFGNQMLFVTATFADEDDFAKAAEYVQEMADLVALQLSE